MRLTLASRRFVTAAAVVGVVLVGCATDNGEAEDPIETPAEEVTPPKEKTPTDAGKPAFDPEFEPDDPPDDDPTPPDGDQCIDKDDPGGSENVAKVLPDTSDKGSTYTTVTGIAKGAVDVDFYKLSATDETGSVLETDFEAQTAGTELCVFLRCKKPTTDPVSGCKQGVLRTSDIGMEGCCVAAPGHAIPEWDCDGITDDDSADFFISVRQINGDRCLPYSFRYRF